MSYVQIPDWDSCQQCNNVNNHIEQFLQSDKLHLQLQSFPGQSRRQNWSRHVVLKFCQERKKGKIEPSLPYLLHAMLCRCSSYLQKTTNFEWRGRGGGGFVLFCSPKLPHLGRIPQQFCRRLQFRSDVVGTLSGLSVAHVKPVILGLPAQVSCLFCNSFNWHSYLANVLKRIGYLVCSTM